MTDYRRGCAFLPLALVGVLSGLMIFTPRNVIAGTRFAREAVVNATDLTDSISVVFLLVIAAAWLIPFVFYVRYQRAMRDAPTVDEPLTPYQTMRAQPLVDRFILSDDPPALSLPVFEDALDDQTGLTLERARLAELRRENDCVRRGLPYKPIRFIDKDDQLRLVRENLAEADRHIARSRELGKRSRQIRF